MSDNVICIGNIYDLYSKLILFVKPFISNKNNS